MYAALRPPPLPAGKRGGSGSGKMDATMQELQDKIEHLYACHVQSMDVIAQQVHEYLLYWYKSTNTDT